MKARSQIITKNYKMPHLYRNELNKIEEIIKELKPRDYKIISSAYEYENINEIPSEIGPLFELEIKTYDPYINIEFRKYEASIYLSNNDLISSGAFSKIDKILTKSERKLFWFPTSNILVPMVLGGIIGQLISRGLPVEPNFLKIFYLFVGILLTIYLFISFKTAFRNFSIIETIQKRERKSFLENNKDQLILITIGAAIGAIATFILEKLFK